MIESNNFLTEDHAEINTITRQKKKEEQQKAFLNLPLKAQESTFFNRSYHLKKLPEQWSHMEFATRDWTKP